MIIISDTELEKFKISIEIPDNWICFSINSGISFIISFINTVVGFLLSPRLARSTEIKR